MPYQLKSIRFIVRTYKSLMHVKLQNRPKRRQTNNTHTQLSFRAQQFTIQTANNKSPCLNSLFHCNNKEISSPFSFFQNCLFSLYNRCAWPLALWTQFVCRLHVFDFCLFDCFDVLHQRMQAKYLHNIGLFSLRIINNICRLFLHCLHVAHSHMHTILKHNIWTCEIIIVISTFR